MNKKLIRLTESDLHRIVEKSVNRILSEKSSGANGKYVMMAFKQNGNEVTESIGKKVTKGKSYWSNTNKRQTYDPYYDDEMRINYTGGRPGVTWDADETPLKYKQSKF